MPVPPVLQRERSRWQVLVSKPDFKYYLITDRHLCAPRPITEVVEEACQAGIKAVQLREKDLDAQQLFNLAQKLCAVTNRYNAQLFLNDRTDIAMVAGCDGVHCREKSLSPRTIKALNEGLMVGASVHSLERAQQACYEGADFLLYGPVFFTPSKASYGPPQGVQSLQEIAEAVSRPVFAVGGITPERAKQCIEAGAAGVAGISSIMESESIEATVSGWKEVIRSL